MLKSRKKSANNKNRSISFAKSAPKQANSANIASSMKFKNSNSKSSKSKSSHANFTLPKSFQDKKFNPHPRPYWAGVRYSLSQTDCEPGAGASKVDYEDILIEGSGFASFYDRLDHLNAKLRH